MAPGRHGVVTPDVRRCGAVVSTQAFDLRPDFFDDLYVVDDLIRSFFD